MDGELGLAEEDISCTLRLRASEHLDTLGLSFPKSQEEAERARRTV